MPADQYVQIQPNSTGAKVDCSELTVAGQTVERQRLVIADPTTAGNLAAVTSGSALKVDGSAVTQPVSGTVGVSNFPATQPVSASALPLPTGASTSAKQPALGTAGSASADVLTVQGVASMTALKVDGSAVTQPVSGTVGVSNFPATQPVSASALPLPTGASTSAKQPALGTAGTPSADVLTVQGATSMTALKVDGSGVTQPVSGTVTCNTHAVTQSGTWTVQPGNTPNTTAWLVTSQPSTAGGLTTAKLISAASTNATSVKTSAGQVYNIQAFNTASSNRFLKLYNKASSPTVGTDTPINVWLIPPSGSGFVIEISNGLACGTGIAFAITGGVADTDTTAIAASDVIVNLQYK